MKVSSPSPSPRELSIAFIATGLDDGGAENMLLQLLATFTDYPKIRPEVYSLTGEGEIAHRIRELGIQVHSFNMKSTLSVPGDFWQLVRLLKAQQPNIIQTWLYHANFIGSLAALLSGNPPLIWGINRTQLFPGIDKFSTILISKLLSRLSHFLPEKIVIASEASKTAHVQIGYSIQKMAVITNGFNTHQFKPDRRARKILREELGIAKNSFVLTHAARYSPVKDHETLLKAFGLLVNEFPHAHLLLCGTGISTDNRELMELVKANPVPEENTHLLGVRRDMPFVFAGSDLVTLASITEALPMAFGEAMSCAIPCVGTEVGEIPKLVGNTGCVVPIKNPEALAKAWSKFVALPEKERTELGKKARKRIRDNYSIEVVSKRFLSLYEAIGNI